MEIALFPAHTKSGIGRYVEEVARALSGEHTIYAIGPEPVDDSGIDWIQFEDASTPFPIRPVKNARGLNTLVSDLDPDVFHAARNVFAYSEFDVPTVGTAWFHPPRLIGALQIVARKHERPSVLNPRFVYRAVRRAYVHFADMRSYRRTDRLISATTALTEALADRGIPTSHVSPPITLPSRPGRGSSGQDVELLLVAGNLGLPTKGVSHLVDAIRHLRERNGVTDFHVRAVGDAPASIRKQVDDGGISDYVTFDGYIDHEGVYERLRNTDLFVAPSLYEEFGYMVLEAIAHGIPVIASQNHSFDDLVPGDAGVRTDVTDAASFADRLQRLIEREDERNAMGRRAREHAESAFSDRVVGSQLLDVYRSAMEGRKPPGATETAVQARRPKGVPRDAN